MAKKARRRRSSTKSDQTPFEVAIHEAGHAVAAFLLKIPMTFASVIAREFEIKKRKFGFLGQVGFTESDGPYPPAAIHHKRTKMAIALLSGCAAEELYFEKSGEGECEGLLRAMFGGQRGDWEVAKYIEGGWSISTYEMMLPERSSIKFQEDRNRELFSKATKLLRKPAHWSAVTALASELMLKREIKEPALSRFIRAAIEKKSQRSGGK